MKMVLRDLSLDPKRFTPRGVANAVSSAKNELIDHETYAARAEGPIQTTYAECYGEYQRRLRGANALDFDDLIMTTVNLLQAAPEVRQYYQERFRHLLVDEYQDTNRAQNELVLILSAVHRNICVVGDSDQSVYRWRGADVRNLLEFERAFPDATVAFTHRDPVAVIQSAITMMAYSDRLRRRSIDPGWLLDYWSDRVHRLLSACVRDRELVADERSIDISFDHLNGNEMSLMEELYRRGQIELTPKVRKKFQQYLDGNPRGKHGRIHYDLERHFGISADELRRRFDFYFTRFDVRPEA